MAEFSKAAQIWAGVKSDTMRCQWRVGVNDGKVLRRIACVCLQGWQKIHFGCVPDVKLVLDIRILFPNYFLY